MNILKKIEIVFIVIIAILVIIHFKIISTKLRDSDALHRLIYSCKDSYSKDWSLNNVGGSGDTMVITFVSNGGDYQEKYISAVNTYHALVGVLFEGENITYRDLKFMLNFDNSPGGNTFLRCYIDYKNHNLSVIILGNTISLADVVRDFPDADEMQCEGLTYNNIEEIQGFTKIKELSLMMKLTEEEKEYIQSIYPDCHIVFSYYQDGVVYYDTEE